MSCSATLVGFCPLPCCPARKRLQGTRGDIGEFVGSFAASYSRAEKQRVTRGFANVMQA